MFKATDHQPIVIWNRKEKRKEIENVYGDALLKWVYGTRPGQTLADQILSKAFLSRVYGAYQSSSLSQHKVNPFVRQFRIPMEEYEGAPFRSFNDFFIRKFKPGTRPLDETPSHMPAFVEARYFAYQKVNSEQKIPVKGAALSPAALLGSEEKARPFVGGPLLLARLCPTDYHRFHFPDNGRILDSYKLHGKLHSVNPMALKFKNEIFITNEREVTLLETRNFGKLAYLEVGALCVGKIVQTYGSKKEFKRGDEKGYFLFGGSTVIVLGEKGAWKPDADLLEQTSENRETLVRLGERIAAV
jgi:phosphatidylserine decarboxylase